MSAAKDEKRNARRIHLAQPVEASLSHVPVKVVDLSTSGARIQHSAPLTFQPEKKFTLDFTCEGESFRLTCTVARQRIDRSNGASGLVYTSGVRFVELADEAVERLWGLIALLAIDVLQQQALAGDAGFDFEILTAH